MPNCHFLSRIGFAYFMRFTTRSVWHGLPGRYVSNMCRILFISLTLLLSLDAYAQSQYISEKQAIEIALNSIKQEKQNSSYYLQNIIRNIPIGSLRLYVITENQIYGNLGTRKL